MRKRTANAARTRFSSLDQTMEGVGIYPEESLLDFTNAEFPYTAELLEASELPTGFVARPFVLSAPWCMQGDPTTSMSKAGDIARCEACGTYINLFADVTSSRWFCSNCGRRNNITDSQTRYRQCDNRNLPELKDNVAEYKMPIAHHGGNEVFSMSASDRPLVHIFLVQENLSVDCMQSVVDALSAASADLHPDIQVVLLTYSNRMGTLSFNNAKGAVAVQYAYFQSQQVQEPIASDGGEDDTASSSASRSALSVPLVDIANLWDLATPIGKCRSSFAEALQGVFDMSVADSNSSPSAANVSLGTLLLAIHEWIADSCVAKRKTKHRQPTNKSFDLSKLWHVFNTEAGLSVPFSAQDVEDQCTGIFVHVFSDTALPAARRSMLDDLQLHAADSIEVLSSNFASIGVSFHLWGLATFDSHELGLVHALPLAQRTGGGVHRIVLGVAREYAQAMFVESLVRVLCTRHATRCLVKVRVSPSLDVSAVTGSYFPDGRAEGLQKVAAMTRDSSLSFELAFRNPVNGSLEEDELDVGMRRSGRMLVVQLAFSFETLVEDVLVAGEERTAAGATSAGGAEEADEDSTGRLPVHAAHVAYLRQSLIAMGLESIPDDVLTALLQEPMGETQSQKTARRRWQAYSSRGVRPYSFKKSLKVVKVLRVISMGLDTTTRLHPVVQSRNNTTTAMLLLRSVYQKELEALSEGAQGETPVSVEPDEYSAVTTVLARCKYGGERQVMNWLVRAMLAYSNQKARAEGSFRGGEDPEIAEGEDSNVGDGVRKQQLGDLIAASPVGDLVFLLCSALMKMVTFQAGNSSSSSSSSSSGASAVLSDRAALFMHEVLTFSPPIVELLLRPEFRAVEENGNLGNNLLALARDAMVRSGSKTFLLDAGIEMIVYSAHLPGSRAAKDGIDPKGTDANDGSSVRAEKAAVRAEARPSASENSWIGHIVRRLSQFPLVRVGFRAEAGTGTASYIAPHLLLDEDSGPISYSALLDFMLNVAATQSS